MYPLIYSTTSNVNARGRLNVKDGVLDLASTIDVAPRREKEADVYARDARSGDQRCSP